MVASLAAMAMNAGDILTGLGMPVTSAPRPSPIVRSARSSRMRPPCAIVEFAPRPPPLVRLARSGRMRPPCAIVGFTVAIAPASALHRQPLAPRPFIPPDRILKRARNPPPLPTPALQPHEPGHRRKVSAERFARLRVDLARPKLWPRIERDQVDLLICVPCQPVAPASRRFCVGQAQQESHTDASDLESVRQDQYAPA